MPSFGAAGAAAAAEVDWPREHPTVSGTHTTANQLRYPSPPREPLFYRCSRPHGGTCAWDRRHVFVRHGGQILRRDGGQSCTSRHPCGIWVLIEELQAALLCWNRSAPTPAVSLAL